MNKQDKELLLKYLCCILPYGVVIQEKCIEHDETFLPHLGDNILVNIDVREYLVITNGDSRYNIEEIKPYLFPLSSMSEEQKEELMNICGERIGFNSGTFIDFNGYGEVPIECVNDVIDWINANHFDYLGLIEKGLAIDCTNLNIY